MRQHPDINILAHLKDNWHLYTALFGIIIYAVTSFSSIETRITKAEADIIVLQKDTQDVKADISLIKNNTSDIKSDISGIKEAVTWLKKDRN